MVNHEDAKDVAGSGWNLDMLAESSGAFEDEDENEYEYERGNDHAEP